ncbi:hypothetical protein LDENG_00256090 [Lucifuga dentata]|nr:hypothetical protein LDENG_00256090 [Lucifuga dentata]
MARLQTALERQESVIIQYHQEFEKVNLAFRSLTETLSVLLDQLCQSQWTTPDAPTPCAMSALSPAHQGVIYEPHLPPPQPYSGDPGTCRSFLSQCSLYFELQPSRFSSDRCKVAAIISLLSGRAREWGTAVWDAQLPICSGLAAFTEEMKRVFDRSVAGHEAAREIMLLCQEHRTLTDYAIQFRTLAASSQWNERALYDAFWQGLSDDLKDKLVSRELPATLNQLLDLATRVDIRLHQRARERAYSRSRDTPVPLTRSPVTSSEPKPHSESEPIQIKWTRLSPVERRLSLLRTERTSEEELSVKDSAHQSDGEILVGVSKHVNFPHQSLLPVILDFAGQ